MSECLTFGLENFDERRSGNEVKEKKRRRVAVASYEHKIGDRLTFRRVRRWERTRAAGHVGGSGSSLAPVRSQLYNALPPR